ncbi:nickel pincer cofactor biosynthesis protein LarC, partial [Chloroflexota bacterium]
MKVAYFDCFSGISGNMILGALIDLGIDVKELDGELSKLPLHYQLEINRVTRKGISAIHVEVINKEGDKQRTLRDVLELIDRSTLEEEVKGTSKQIFARLGEAEARVHNQDLNTVHFHEIGAVDTFIDVVGAVVGLKMLGVEKIVCSPLNVGKGTVKCAHGVLPVPAPVTVELLKGVPVYTTDSEGELTTPTGAAIITSLATGFGNLTPMAIEKTGYGAGSMELETPNLLRLWAGEMRDESGDYIAEEVTVMETNIDDMNPQFYDHIMERLLHAGALDVTLTPMQMKKNRPGTIVSVIAPGDRVEGLLDILFQESSTLGIRITETRRLSLPRSLQRVETKFGELRIKVAHRGDRIAR